MDDLKKLKLENVMGILSKSVRILCAVAFIIIATSFYHFSKHDYKGKVKLFDSDEHAVLTLDAQSTEIEIKKVYPTHLFGAHLHTVLIQDLKNVKPIYGFSYNRKLPWLPLYTGVFINSEMRIGINVMGGL